MADDSYLVDLLKRVCACDKEAMTGVVSFKASRVFGYAQETFPYMVNRLGTKIINESADDTFDYIRNIAKRLVVAHKTEGFDGQASDKVADWLTLIEDYYRENIDLISPQFETEPAYLSPLGVTLGNDTGLVAFANSGTGTIQIGVEFVLQVPILKSNY